jgi:hypothetical protein
MSLVRRLTMGPLVDHECRNCQRILTVVLWRWALVAVPLYIAVFVLLIAYPALSPATAIGGLLLSFALTPSVPLTARET